VFDGGLPADLLLVWNPRLTATAGQVVDDGSRNSEKSSRDQRIPVRLELSAKVRCKEQCLLALLPVSMCHEPMCHRPRLMCLVLWMPAVDVSANICWFLPRFHVAVGQSYACRNPTPCPCWCLAIPGGWGGQVDGLCSPCVNTHKHHLRYAVVAACICLCW
jgi:hypothetical protein